MRVAVHLPNASPTQGGGFTFQDSLQAAIERSSGHSSHEFIVFTETPSTGTSRPNIVHIPSGRGDRVLRRAQLLANHAQDVLLRRRYWQFDTRFEQLVREARCDVVWFATPSYIECSAPYLYTIWDLQHLDQPWFPEVGRPGDFHAREQMMRSAIARAACILTPNQQGAEELVRGYAVHASRVVTVPHPTPDFALAAATHAPHELPAELQLKPGYLLYPAQFWAHKNHVTLLHALKRLHEAGSELTLVLVGGDKGNRAHIESTASALGLTKHVRILGFVEQSALVALYQNAGCLVYASFFGPENLPPLEAFALGCPVVCANYRGAQEQLGDAAELVSPTDDAAFAAAVQRVLGDSTRRAGLIERGKRRAAQFTAVDYLRDVTRFLDAFAKIRANWA